MPVPPGWWRLAMLAVLTAAGATVAVLSLARLPPGSSADRLATERWLFGSIVAAVVVFVAGAVSIVRRSAAAGGDGGPPQLPEGLAGLVDRRLELLPAVPHAVVGLELTTGEPVVPTLLRGAGRRGGDRIVVLSGAGGSGKTTALALLAVACRATWRRRRGAVIPVYVDLAAYSAQPVTPLRAYLEGVLTGDERLRELLRAAWRPSGAKATWLFLVDDLDRASACAQVTDRAKLIDEIDGFLVSISPTRAKAVVTSRHEVRAAGAATMTVAPLGYESQQALLGGLPGLHARLSTDKTIRPFVGNPGWLSLLARTPPEPAARWPDGQFSLMAELVERRLRAAGVPGSATLDAVLEAMAVTLSGSSLGAGEARDVATAVSLETGLSAGEAAEGIALLRRAGLVESRRASAEIEIVQFAADAILIHLLARRLLRDVGAIPVRQLYGNVWFARAAALVVRAAGDDTVARFTGEATAMLDAVAAEASRSEGPPTAGELFRDVSATVEMLRSIDAGLQHRPELVPADLRRRAGALLGIASLHGGTELWVRLLDLSGLVPPRRAAAVHGALLGSPDGREVEVAAGRLVASRGALDLIPAAGRMTVLLVTALTGLGRLAAGPLRDRPDRRVELASGCGTGAAVTFGIAYGLGAVLQFLARPELLIFEVLEFGVFVIVTGSVLAGRRSAPVRRRLLAHPGRVISVLGVLAAGGAAAGTLVAINALATFSAPVLALFLFGLLAWPYCALVYLANDTQPSVGRVVFPFPWAARPIWQMLAH